jgi:hypothetical protein
VASSAAAVDSEGLRRAIRDETGLVVQPVGREGRKSYGRGAGLEVGLIGGRGGNRLQLAVAGVSEAEAPPAGDAPVHELGPVRLSPIAYASLVQSRADPAWSTSTCVIGRPLSFGLGSAADVQVLGLGPEGPGGQLSAPLVATDAGGPATRSVVQSRALTYLVPNANESFSLVGEIRQTFAPVTLFRGSPVELTVELLGEFVLRATATGQTGGAHVDYAPAGNPTPTTPVLRIIQRERVIELTFQQVFGDGGLTLAVDPLVRVTVAEHARRLASPGGQPDPRSAPEEAADGTLASGAVDVVRVTVLDQPVAGSARAADVSLGHMEVTAAAPAGGVACGLPVHKSNAPTFVEPGGSFTWTISIPSHAGAMDGIRCDLVGISAVDTASATTGVRFRITAASRGGVIDGRTVTWRDLGRYHPGDPPIVVTVNGAVDPDSEAGTLSDTVKITAGLADCAGDQDPAGGGVARLDGARVDGVFTLRGPMTS